MIEPRTLKQTGSPRLELECWIPCLPGDHMGIDGTLLLVKTSVWICAKLLVIAST
jgi:hypothetical protein